MKSKFDENFEEPMYFTHGCHVVTGKITKYEAARRFEHYIGEHVNPESLVSDRVRFGFPGENMKEGGIECPNSESGRRTFSTKLHRQGIHIAHIHHLLGNVKLETTKKLTGNDPVCMGGIAARAY